MKLKEGFSSPIARVRQQYQVYEKNAEIERQVRIREMARLSEIEMRRLLWESEKRLQFSRNYGTVLGN